VNMPETLSVGEKMLKLNGLGLRKKVVFKVYVGGLYLETPSNDAAAILASDQAKAVRMTFLRDVSKSQLRDAFVEGFEAKREGEGDLPESRDREALRTARGHQGNTDARVLLPAGQGHDCLRR